MADQDKDGSGADSAGEDRRLRERRQAQQPFDGPDRRKVDRRSGKERRTTERHSGDEISEA